MTSTRRHILFFCYNLSKTTLLAMYEYCIIYIYSNYSLEYHLYLSKYNFIRHLLFSTVVSNFLSDIEVAWLFVLGPETNVTKLYRNKDKNKENQQKGNGGKMMDVDVMRYKNSRQPIRRANIIDKCILESLKRTLTFRSGIISTIVEWGPGLRATLRPCHGCPIARNIFTKYQVSLM